MLPDSTDILHNGGLENLEDYKIFKRRYPQRTTLPTRSITDWYIQEIPTPGRPNNTWICLVGIHKDTLIRTSPITSIINPRRICTNNCIYVLGPSCKVLDHSTRGLENYFLDGFPNDWEELVERAALRSNTLEEALDPAAMGQIIKEDIPLVSGSNSLLTNSLSKPKFIADLQSIPIVDGERESIENAIFSENSENRRMHELSHDGCADKPKNTDLEDKGIPPHNESMHNIGVVLESKPVITNTTPFSDDADLVPLDTNLYPDLVQKDAPGISRINEMLNVDPNIPLFPYTSLGIDAKKPDTCVSTASLEDPAAEINAFFNSVSNRNYGTCLDKDFIDYDESLLDESKQKPVYTTKPKHQKQAYPTVEEAIRNGPFKLSTSKLTHQDGKLSKQGSGRSSSFVSGQKLEDSCMAAIGNIPNVKPHSMSFTGSKSTKISNDSSSLAAETSFFSNDSIRKIFESRGYQPTGSASTRNSIKSIEEMLIQPPINETEASLCSVKDLDIPFVTGNKLDIQNVSLVDSIHHEGNGERSLSGDETSVMGKHMPIGISRFESEPDGIERTVVRSTCDSVVIPYLESNLESDISSHVSDGVDANEGHTALGAHSSPAQLMHDSFSSTSNTKRSSKSPSKLKPFKRPSTKLKTSSFDHKPDISQASIGSLKKRPSICISLPLPSSKKSVSNAVFDQQSIPFLHEISSFKQRDDALVPTSLPSDGNAIESSKTADDSYTQLDLNDTVVTTKEAPGSYSTLGLSSELDIPIDPMMEPHLSRIRESFHASIEHSLETADTKEMSLESDASAEQPGPPHIESVEKTANTSASTDPVVSRRQCTGAVSQGITNLSVKTVFSLPDSVEDTKEEESTESLESESNQALPTAKPSKNKKKKSRLVMPKKPKVYSKKKY